MMIEPYKQHCYRCKDFNGGDCKLNGRVKALDTHCYTWKPSGPLFDKRPAKPVPEQARGYFKAHDRVKRIAEARTEASIQALMYKEK